VDELCYSQLGTEKIKIFVFFKEKKLDFCCI